MKMLKRLFWLAPALLAALALAVVTLLVNPAEKVNALWLVTAAACVYLLSYRFYAAFLAAKVLALDERRVTPAMHADQGRRKLRSYESLGALWDWFMGGICHGIQNIHHEGTKNTKEEVFLTTHCIS